MKKNNLNTVNLPSVLPEVIIPNYNRLNIKTGIVHVGIGGFHRAHEAFLTDKLLHNDENKNWGICGIALLDYDSKIYNVLKNQDGLYTLVIKNLDGTLKTQIIGSIIEYLFAPENPTAVIDKMANPETKIITLTITEGGYNFNEATGEFQIENPLIQHDLKNSKTPKTIFGYLTQAILKRKEANTDGFTIQSCDNIQGNGDITKKMLLSYIAVAEPSVLNWVHKNVSFPNSMVDRITPATTPLDIALTNDLLGLNDQWPVVCEPFIQWVIEDDFIAGRPPWENVGAQFVTDVTPYEKMKLTLLNAGHSVLGILGALLGYTTIDEVVNNKVIKEFLIDFMDVEVTPIIGKLEGIDLTEYKKSLLERFGNINIKDQVSRICLESSAKIPKFVLPTIKSRLERGDNLTHSSFVIAAWAIYNLGKDNAGNAFNIEDNMKDILHKQASAAEKNPLEFLKIPDIFGDLATNEQFANSYLKAYTAIKKDGIKKSVMKINTESKKFNI